MRLEGDNEENEKDIGESHGKDAQRREKRDGNEYRDEQHIEYRQISHIQAHRRGRSMRPHPRSTTRMRRILTTVTLPK
jgi:hypothetical protein